MLVQPTEIADVVEFIPRVLEDERGYFVEVMRESWFDAKRPPKFVQSNQSSSNKGVLRGLHYQLVQPQGKLVRVIRGEIYDVAVDMREKSPTFGQWVGRYLNDKQKNSLWVPAGFAHGFLVMSSTAEVLYSCTDYYHPQSEVSLHWQDPQLQIDLRTGTRRCGDCYISSPAR